MTGKERAKLRAVANSFETILYVGKNGVGDEVIKEADDALNARELIKGKVHETWSSHRGRCAAYSARSCTPSRYR